MSAVLKSFFFDFIGSGVVLCTVRPSGIKLDAAPVGARFITEPLHLINLLVMYVRAVIVNFS